MSTDLHRINYVNLSFGLKYIVHTNEIVARKNASIATFLLLTIKLARGSLELE